MDKEERAFYEKLEGKGVSRRDFMKFCTFLTATMGLTSSFVPKVAEVFAQSAQRPPVIYLHLGECTGCTESLIRTMYPWIDTLVLEVLDVAYQETIMAAAGHQAEEALHAAVEKYNGKFICVVEGAVATKYNGGYGKVADKTFPADRQGRLPEGGGRHLHRQLLGLRQSPGRQAQPGRLQERRRSAGYQNRQHRRLPPQPDQLRRHGGQLSPPRQAAGPGQPGPPVVRLRADHSRQLPAPRPLRERRVRHRVRAPRKRPKVTASTRWVAAAPRPTTTAASSSSTAVPAGRSRRGTPASAAASRTSGTSSRRSTRRCSPAVNATRDHFIQTRRR